MKLVPKKRLFWFLKDGVILNLSDPNILDMYIQQVLSYGKTEDIKDLFDKLNFENIKEAFLRIKRFLPVEVKMFWEDFIGSD